MHFEYLKKIIKLSGIRFHTFKMMETSFIVCTIFYKDKNNKAKVFEVSLPILNLINVNATDAKYKVLAYDSAVKTLAIKLGYNM